jgi:hypothetical protein
MNIGMNIGEEDLEDSLQDRQSAEQGPGEEACTNRQWEEQHEMYQWNGRELHD